MSVNTLYKFLKIAGAVQTNQITDEVYTDVGSDDFQLGTVKRAFLGGADLVIRTAAAGGGDLLVEDVDYEVLNEDFDYTEESGFHVYTGIRVLTGAYQSGDLYFTYKTIGSYTDPDVFNDVLERVINGMRVGKIEITEEVRTLATDMPWYNLANPTETLAAANYIDYVPYLRAIRAHTKWTSAKLTGTVTLAASVLTGDGTNFDPELTVNDLLFIDKLNQLRYCATRTSDTAATVSEPGTAAAGAKIYKLTRQSSPASYNYDFPITAYQITGATAFSLWMNEGSDTKYPENYILLRALAEAYAYDREYGTLTLPEAIGGIPAGDYQITGITLANIGTSSAVITCSASGLSAGSKTADTSSINVYPHRIAGSTTTARHKELTDAALMNDGLYNVLGLAQRDQVEPHEHNLNIGTSGGAAYTDGDTQGLATVASTPTQTQPAFRTKNLWSGDSMRTGPISRPRSGIFNFYAYVGTYAS